MGPGRHLLAVEKDSSARSRGSSAQRDLWGRCSHQGLPSAIRAVVGNLCADLSGNAPTLRATLTPPDIKSPHRAAWSEDRRVFVTASNQEVRIWRVTPSAIVEAGLLPQPRGDTPPPGAMMNQTEEMKIEMQGVILWNGEEPLPRRSGVFKQPGRSLHRPALDRWRFGTPRSSELAALRRSLRPLIDTPSYRRGIDRRGLPGHEW